MTEWVVNKKEVYGIDFSGAKDAGRHIWISKGIASPGRLIIKSCFPASALPSSGISLDKCLPALRQLVTSEKSAIFGFDFPFGLPAELVRHGSWKDFILAFSRTYKDSGHFRNTCLAATGNKELKRGTDIFNRAPLSPYNLRLYRQTYYGITQIIAPLVADDKARFIPMQKPVTGKPWVLEICPASTLKAMRLYAPYKGPDRSNEARTRRRQQILKGILANGQQRLDNSLITAGVLENPSGDALDSVIACFATFCALKKGVDISTVSRVAQIEGTIFGAFE
ncbi:MAG TPA: DUF429 domain-containing protein [Desulfobacterales bacterium]|nr:DUF429 domain-containing protein [Desulfobacterales bacterium]